MNITLDKEQAMKPDVELLSLYDRIMVPRDVLVSDAPNADAIKIIYETLSMNGHEVVYYK